MKDVKPFFVPDPGDVRASAWSRLVDEEWEALGTFVPDWDYRTKLKVRCTLATDVDAVHRRTRLSEHDPIAWAVGWRATDTGLVGEPGIIPMSDTPVTIDLEVPAERAGATVVLTRRLVLQRDRMFAGPGEARWAGSILWSDETPLRLTGSGAAFPTEVVDFNAYGRDPSASWYLELPSTPDSPSLGAMILLINSADTALVEAVARARPSDLQQILVQQMEEGVVEQLVRWALARWSELDDLDADSVGAAARLLTERVLPEPEAWTGDYVDSMELGATIIGGARRIGWGRAIA